MKKVYEHAKENKKLAASILIPLIEFEFSFIAEDSPVLIQSVKNRKQLEAVFSICKSHGWSTKLIKKGDNVGFRLHRKAFEEIYEIAGEFADPIKNDWAKLILERRGKKGGYMADKISTKQKLIEKFAYKKEKWWSVGELCLDLRLMPSTIRESLRDLESTHKVERLRESKRILWKYRDSSLETLPGKTAG